MPDYLVTWSIDITADTPEEAAREAWRLMRGRGSIANVFDVFDGVGEPVRIDLQAIEEAKPGPPNARDSPMKYLPMAGRAVECSPCRMLSGVSRSNRAATLAN